MFRRLAGSLPEDPSWEADLTKLGYFVNEKSQIRQIRNPTERFLFKVTDNGRFNEVHKEAFHKCLRKELASRMEHLGAPKLYLPALTIKPDGPSVPIFATRQVDLKTKKSIIIIVNDHMQELGVWAYRKICDDDFDTGSCTSIAKAISLRHHSIEDEPGLIVLNPGQYYYSHKENRSLSQESWEALPRKSLYHPTVKVHEVHNLVPGSRDRHEHIATVFDKVINNGEYVSKDAKLYIIGICEGSSSVLSYLDQHWATMSSRVKAAAWVHPYVEPEYLKPPLAKFIETRTRAWAVSNAPVNTCIGIPDHDPKPARCPDEPRSWEDQDDEPIEDFVCPTFSGGEEEFAECVFPTSYQAMLDFFDEVKRGGEKYINPAFEPVKQSIEEKGTGTAAGFDSVDLTVKEVDKTGTAVPHDDGQREITEEIKKVELQEGEVEVAGVAVARDLLEKAGLD